MNARLRTFVTGLYCTAISSDDHYRHHSYPGVPHYLDLPPPWLYYLLTSYIFFAIALLITPNYIAYVCTLHFQNSVRVRPYLLPCVKSYYQSQVTLCAISDLGKCMNLVANQSTGLIYIKT